MNKEQKQRLGSLVVGEYDVSNGNAEQPCFEPITVGDMFRTFDGAASVLILEDFIDQLVAEEVGKLFTPPELYHLKTIMRDVSDRGEYYGNREQY